MACLLVPGAPLAAGAADVELSLVGGEVVGLEPGLGEASVEARVRNNGGRSLKGIRIAVYYSSRDALPPSNAEWLIHEFVFEPPLKPGGQSTLRFSDPNAAEYVALAVRRAIFEPGLSFNGEEARLEQPLLLREGSSYIALRDLAALLGARISLGADGWVAVQPEQGEAVELKSGADFARTFGGNQALDLRMIEIDGRSYLALSEAARLFGLQLREDPESSLFELES